MVERKFMLLSKDAEGHDVVMWLESEKELLWCVNNNKALTPYYAIEIFNYREIELPKNK